MSHLKYVLLAATAIAFGNAFADAANLLVSFSTKGPDLYSDGTTVKDGEWYALVWAASAEAEKFDEVILAAPIAKDGHCPYALFQVDSSDKQRIKTTGYYYVCLLDTRDSSGEPAKVPDSGEIPEAVKTANANRATPTTRATGGELRVSNNDSAIDPRLWPWDDKAVAEIKSIMLVGENVQLRVVNMNPAFNYSLAGGEELSDAVEGKVISDLDPMVEEAKNNQENPFDGANLIFERAFGRFFKLVRHPVATETVK